MIVSVSPRTVCIQAATSSAFETVAESATIAISVGQVDDHLLPHRAAGAVLEVVHLVEHDVAQAVERR